MSDLNRYLNYPNKLKLVFTYKTARIKRSTKKELISRQLNKNNILSCVLLIFGTNRPNENEIGRVRYMIHKYIYYPSIYIHLAL